MLEECSQATLCCIFFILTAKQIGYSLNLFKLSQITDQQIVILQPRQKFTSSGESKG